MLFGPIMGSYLFLWGGFQCPFYVMGAVLCALIGVLQFTVPNRKKEKIDDEDGLNKLLINANKRSGFWYLLKNFVSSYYFILSQCVINTFANRK
jgi:hypothetical protein